MRFSDIGSNIELENKQRINLSGHAYTVLAQDASLFFPVRPNKTETGGIPSGILNHIFYHFRESAESSIEEALQNRKQTLNDVLQSMSSDASKQAAITLLLQEYQSNLEQKRNARLAQKGCSFSFRIDSANLQELSTEMAQKESVHYTRSKQMLLCHDEGIALFSNVLTKKMRLLWFCNHGGRFVIFIQLVQRASFHRQDRRSAYSDLIVLLS